MNIAYFGLRINHSKPENADRETGKDKEIRGCED
jgi:hypothetical protein